MNTIRQKIGGDENVRTGRVVEDGRVVTDTQNRARSERTAQPGDEIDETLFAETSEARHDLVEIGCLDGGHRSVRTHPGSGATTDRVSQSDLEDLLDVRHKGKLEALAEQFGDLFEMPFVRLR